MRNCPEQFSVQSVLFEPSESSLPAGLLVSPCLVQVTTGTVYFPVVNVGTTEVLLYPRTSLGTLNAAQVVSLLAGATEVVSLTARVSSQAATTSEVDKLGSQDLSELPKQDQTGVRSLLQKYSSVFAAHDGDLGYTKLLSHGIPLLDDVPVLQRYRRIPPLDYGAVKAHVN